MIIEDSASNIKFLLKSLTLDAIFDLFHAHLSEDDKLKFYMKGIDGSCYQILEYIPRKVERDDGPSEIWGDASDILKKIKNAKGNVRLKVEENRIVVKYGRTTLKVGLKEKTACVSQVERNFDSVVRIKFVEKESLSFTKTVCDVYVPDVETSDFVQMVSYAKNLQNPSHYILSVDKGVCTLGVKDDTNETDSMFIEIAKLDDGKESISATSNYSSNIPEVFDLLSGSCDIYFGDKKPLAIHQEIQSHYKGKNLDGNKVEKTWTSFSVLYAVVMKQKPKIEIPDEINIDGLDDDDLEVTDEDIENPDSEELETLDD